MTSPVLEELAQLRDEVAALREARVTRQGVSVTAVDRVAGTITGVLPDSGEEVSGISWPTQFLPEVGEDVQVWVAGAVPVATPAGIAADAITERELDPAVINKIERGGVSYYTSTVAPPHTGPADSGIWINIDPDVRRMSRWDGDSWEPIQFGTLAFAAGAITAVLLAADAVDGKTITGATLQTAEEGARLVLDSLSGLRGINAAGVVKTQLDTDGKLTAVDATIVGELNTAADGPRLRLSQDLSDPEMPTGSLEMYTGLPTDSPAQISATSWQELDGFGNPVTSSADLRIFGAAGELQLQPSIFLRGSKDLNGLWVRRIDLNGEVWAPDARWPLGIVAGTGVFIDATLTTTAAAETRLAGAQNHASVPLRKGRAYEAVYVGLIQANTAAANRCIVTIRAAPENTTPTTTSNLASWVSIHVPLVGAAGQGTVDTSGQPFTVGSDRSLAFHIFAANNAATGTVSLVPTGPSTATPAPKHGIIIRDIGPATADMRVLAA